MANQIDTAARRKKLAPKREPYWHKITPGRYLGFRRTESGGNWIARYYDSSTRKNRYSALEVPYLWGDKEAYKAAHERALEWFNQIAGAENVHYRVKDAVAAYVEHLKIHNSVDSSQGVKQRLDKHLIPKLGEIELAKLKTAQFKHWLQGLVRLSDDEADVDLSKDGANHLLSIAKAAFNLAFNSGAVSSDREWRRVKPFKGVGDARKVFLTDAQVKRLLENTDGGFHNLCKAGILTGARYGELISACARDFHKTNGTLRLSGKTGERYCYLSNDGLKFCKQISKDRLPDAFLLVKDNGEPWKKSHQFRPMNEAIKKAKLPRDTVFYSLRHYHISKALLAGLPMQLIAENCGTSVRMIEKHYGKFLPKDRRAMFNQVVLG